VVSLTTLPIASYKRITGEYSIGKDMEEASIT
jgi:hypothetical protein